VLEECDTEEQRSVERFLWGKGLNANDIHKEKCPVYGGKYFSRSHLGGKHFADEEEVQTEVRK
jgi:hypothetical protein